ncbi:GLPGLI family protein [Fodinibius sp. AD559]|uniref:GLPGLI family protein n=1 Tax=Fodinibius sp. AD559 TaxID=3424179 RepID=UPI0040469D30
MKKVYLSFLISLFILLSSSKVFAQGKVTYTAILESQDFRELKAELIFKDNLSLFSFLPDTTAKAENVHSMNLNNASNAEFEISIGEPLASYHQVFIDRSAQKVVASERYFKNGELHPCITIEPTGLIDWELKNEQKEISSFTATKATASFRGRNYTAWFTTEIPVDEGPWKFHGLPGLILEVYDEEKGVQFLMSKIEIPYQVNPQDIEAPDKGKRLTIKEYATYQENFVDELVELIRAKLPRDAKISNVSTTQVNKGIEREY